VYEEMPRFVVKISDKRRRGHHHLTNEVARGPTHKWTPYRWEHAAGGPAASQKLPLGLHGEGFILVYCLPAVCLFVQLPRDICLASVPCLSGRRLRWPDANLVRLRPLSMKLASLHSAPLFLPNLISSGILRLGKSALK